MNSVADTVELDRIDCASKANELAESVVSAMRDAYAKNRNTDSRTDARSRVFDVLFRLEERGYDVIPYLGQAIDIISGQQSKDI